MTVHAPTSIAESLREMKEALGDRILLDEEVRAPFRSDFGRMVDRLPGAVVRCAAAAEVAELVRYCRQAGLPIHARGQGHTQSGQATSQGGVLLDNSAMNRIHAIDGEGLTAVCDAGVVWRDLVAASVPRGLVPPVLTNNLGVSISGTLSVAGLGVASYRYGTQADNALELEVVIGEGEIVTCSAAENRELFDVVRCGFGQFGIITRAKLRLRRCRPQVRMYYLLYDDLGAFMKDAEAIMDPADPRFH